MLQSSRLWHCLLLRRCRFTFHYSTIEPPHIQNDVITLNKTYAADHQVKLAISHALAQSTLLGCYEERLQVGLTALHAELQTASIAILLVHCQSTTRKRKEHTKLVGTLWMSSATGASQWLLQALSMERRM